MQRGAVAGAFRTIPFKILTFEELGLPAMVAELAQKPSGLVLVTGPTGSGKTHDARGDDRQDQQRAALPHHHDRRPDRVPAPAQALDRQPARGRDRHRGLQDRAQVRPPAGPGRRARRRDARPRDHRGGARPSARPGTSSSRRSTRTAPISTINRIIDVFPPHQQEQMRSKLSFVLQGVVTPAAPAADGRRPGACMALEVMRPERRDPEPDPRGQGPPDLHADAGGPGQVRDADPQSGALRARTRTG